jgi:hypothetical protein
VALQNHPYQSTGPIVSKQRWPATSGAAPVLVPSAPLAVNLGTARQAATAQGPIGWRVRFPYTSGAAPVFVEGFDDPSPPENIDKWLASYPNWLDRRRTHPAQVPSGAAYHPDPVFTADRFAWYLPSPGPSLRPNLAALFSSGGVRVPLRVEITPAMWTPVYPNYINRTQQTRTGHQAFISLQLSTILPSVAAWQAVYPDFTRARRPIHHLAPSNFHALRDPNGFIPKIAEWAANYPEFTRKLKPNQFWQVAWFGPDTDRPDQPTEVDDGFVWFMQQPDFARGRPIIHHLVPVTWWHTITGPDVRRPSKRGGLLLMKVGS